MPFKSAAQRRLMFAAAHGSTRAGVPKAVAQEFIRESHGQGKLPERMEHNQRMLHRVRGRRY